MDPELARVARAQLPPPIWSLYPPRVAPVIAQAAVSDSRSRVRLPISPFVVVMTFLAAVIGLSLSTEVWQPESQRPTLESGGPSLGGSALHRPYGSYGVAGEVMSTNTATAATKVATTAATVPLPTKEAAPQPTTGTPTPGAPQHVSSTGETVLRWSATSNASYYNVVLWHSGERVLDVWPNRPNVVVPHAWNYRGKTYRLEPGRYLWFVYPYLGPRGRGHFVGLTEHGVLLSKPASGRKQGG